MGTARLAGFLVVIVSLPLAASLVRVWTRQQAVSLGYQLHQAEQRTESLRAEVQKAEILRAAGRTPQKVGAMARALGLGPAEAAQVLPLRAAAPMRRATPRQEPPSKQHGVR